MKAALLATAMALGLTASAQAQIKIGAILSISGPAAAMGVGYKGAFDLFPTEIAGQKVEYIIRDDATDASTAYTIAQKMISEDHVDAFIGPSLTASDAAVAPLANQANVPCSPWRRTSTTRKAALHLQRCPTAVPDGLGRIQVHAATRREDHRLHRLLRRLGRSGARLHQGIRLRRRHPDPRRRTLRPHRHHLRGAGTEADQHPPASRDDGQLRHARRAARRRAASPGLQGRHLRQPRHRLARLHQSRRHRCRGRHRRHLPVVVADELPASTRSSPSQQHS